MWPGRGGRGNAVRDIKFGHSGSGGCNTLAAGASMA